VYSTLGARLDVVEVLDGLMSGWTGTWSRYGDVQRAPLRQADAEDQDHQGGSREGRTEGVFRRRECSGQPQLYDIILCFRGPDSQRQEDRADPPA